MASQCAEKIGACSLKTVTKVLFFEDTNVMKEVRHL